MPRRTRAANFLVEHTPANENQLSDDQAHRAFTSRWRDSSDMANSTQGIFSSIMSAHEKQRSHDQADMSPMSCFSIMSPNDIKISDRDTRRIKEELDTCIEITQGTSPEQLHESRDGPERPRILYRLSNMGTQFTDIYPEDPRNCCENEADFWSKSGKDDRYIILSNDKQADKYVTNISPSNMAYFLRLNVLNILKTWTNAGSWKCMSNTTPPFILERDTLVLLPDHKNGEFLRVKINGVLLHQADEPTPYVLQNRDVVTVECCQFDDDWETLFTFKYRFKHISYIAQNTNLTANWKTAEREVTSARMALEKHLKTAKSLTENLEMKMMSRKSCEATCLRMSEAHLLC